MVICILTLWALQSRPKLTHMQGCTKHCLGDRCYRTVFNKLFDPYWLLRACWCSRNLLCIFNEPQHMWYSNLKGWALFDVAKRHDELQIVSLTVLIPFCAILDGNWWLLSRSCPLSSVSPLADSCTVYVEKQIWWWGCHPAVEKRCSLLHKYCNLVYCAAPAWERPQQPCYIQVN